MGFDVANVAVVAGSNLPKGTLYGPLKGFEFPPVWIDSIDLTRNNQQLIQTTFEIAVEDKNIEIICWYAVRYKDLSSPITIKDGKLVPNNYCVPWIQCLRSSRDIYEQNIEAIRSRDDGVFIRSTRAILPGEVLCGWYEESYAREKGVPHLTLQNIKGTQDYRCHMCCLGFSYPNQLKAHIMYSCHVARSHVSRDVKINSIKSENIEPSMLKSGSETVDNRYEKGERENMSPLSENGSKARSFYTRSSQDYGNLTDLRCQYLASINCQFSCEINRDSFIEPCRLETKFSLVPRAGEVIHKHGHVTSSKENSPREKVDIHAIANQPRHITLDNDVEPLEVLHKSFIEFSTKRGHLCVYCGKFYSRKYGLKIHLRTHTGYKPLKCKICLRAFGDPSNLNKHIRLHAEGSTPYRCKHCGKVLVRRRDLVRHLKSRHPDADRS